MLLWHLMKRMDKDSQKDVQNSLYRVLPAPVQKKKWVYGYNREYDIVVISKDGTLGAVYEISGLKIGIPEAPKQVHQRSGKKSEQYWERVNCPSQLEKIKSIFQWNEMPRDFKESYAPYIESEFDKRDAGEWFMNNGVPTYITGAYYMYLQW